MFYGNALVFFLSHFQTQVSADFEPQTKLTNSASREIEARRRPKQQFGHPASAYPDLPISASAHRHAPANVKEQLL
jgi:hypothetical protein